MASGLPPCQPLSMAASPCDMNRTILAEAHFQTRYSTLATAYADGRLRIEIADPVSARFIDLCGSDLARLAEVIAAAQTAYSNSSD